MVWKFDRFARSLKQLLNALELFRTLNIGFVSCTEAIDTSLPHGEMLFQIMGAIAQWERAIIAERVRAGLQHARSQGKRLGLSPASCVEDWRNRKDSEGTGSDQSDVPDSGRQIRPFCVDAPHSVCKEKLMEAPSDWKSQ